MWTPDALDFAGWDLFFWLVLSGVIAHLLLVLWLCRTCWASFVSWGRTTITIPSRRTSRVKAGEGEPALQTELAGNPGGPILIRKR